MWSCIIWTNYAIKIKERSGRCALKTSISICLSSLQVLCSSPPALCLGPRAKLWAGWLQHWETKDSTGIHCEVQRMNDRKKKQNRKHVFCASYAVFCFNFFFWELARESLFQIKRGLSCRSSVLLVKCRCESPEAFPSASGAETLGKSKKTKQKTKNLRSQQ